MYEPHAVAVVGMGCELPSVSGPKQLWRRLVDRHDAIGVARPESGMAYAGSIDHAPGRHVATFDAEGFGIAHAEAERMDPHQRVLLHVVRDALDDAHLSYDGIAGSRTGVFAGQSNSDAWTLRSSDPDLDVRDFAGCHQRALLTGRVSHVFDLRGPSVTVDAAQASSLVALQLAIRALRAGDADIAIAAGVNVLVGPQPGGMLGPVLSPTGRCGFADASADGFVRSEGVAAVVLKPLRRALDEGDRIRAVVAGSAVSNDGRAKPSLLHASVEGQMQAMKWAYADSGIDPGAVGYVEAHGTGTPIDLVELQALAEVVGKRRDPDRTCFVGSLKTNIGHLEAASGIAGFMKAVLCLEHGAIPASLHFESPHPQFDWRSVPFSVPTELRPLPESENGAVVAVNGQSISSTNVHMILRSSPSM